MRSEQGDQRRQCDEWRRIVQSQQGIRLVELISPTTALRWLQPFSDKVPVRRVVIAPDFQSWKVAAV